MQLRCKMLHSIYLKLSRHVGFGSQYLTWENTHDAIGQNKSCSYAQIRLMPHRCWVYFNFLFQIVLQKRQWENEIRSQRFQISFLWFNSKMILIFILLNNQLPYKLLWDLKKVIRKCCNVFPKILWVVLLDWPKR